MRTRRTARDFRQRLTRLDLRLLASAARNRSPVSNRVMMTASNLANRSALWTAMAAGLAATGRRRPRTAAASGLLGIGVAATLVNGPLKFAWRRDRPPLTPGGEPLLPLPRTFSFPSGHAASAFAFATGVSAALPVAGAVVVPAATTVAYSRVHTGVHYPSDVVVGATIGVASGLVAARVVKRSRESSRHRVDAPALDVPIPRRVVLLASQDSAGADGLAAARASIDAAGFDVEKLIDVDDADELTRIVERSDEPLLVVAAGGDGTVCMAANAVADSAALLAIVPLGTSNDVARSLGIPPNPTEAVDALADGRVCDVDLACLQIDGGESRLFLNAATAGLNVAFARHATDPSLRNRLGRLTYPFAAARALRQHEPFECTLESERGKQTISVVHLSVSNAPVFGGPLGMRVPGASMTDGLLDVIAIEPLSPLRLTLAVADALVGRHRPVHGVHAMRVRSLRVVAEPGQEVAVDGEVAGELPARFEARPRGLRVVVPAAPE